MTRQDFHVKTAAGRVSGSQAGGVQVFKGIPYAEPPEGLHRFQPPRPLEAWKGVREATRPGGVPIQPAMPVLRFMNAGASRQSEDCLYLNVWTPGTGRARRPVFVWIHGGGFLIGAGSSPIYDGGQLARNGDMVVVTINYRLGALGYVHLGGLGIEGLEEASNLGVRDQIAALEWVRDNIERFGGDPGNVTVAGQSAGAMSVGALLGAPSARGLFHRAILQSAAGRHVLGRDEADRVADRFLHELGKRKCTPSELAEVPVAEILRAQGLVNREFMNARDLMVMMPCIDGELVTESPLEAIKGGAASEIELMIGTTLDEWKLFTPVDTGLLGSSESRLVARFADLLPEIAENSPSPEQAALSYREAVRERGGRTTPFEVWSAFQSMRVFHRPSVELADAQVRAGGRAHSYLFAWKPAAFSQTLGACHAMDLPFVFGRTSDPLTRALTGFAFSARRLSSRMQAAWAGFSHGGSPCHDELPEWDSYDSATRPTMVFDRECTLADSPLAAERKLIDAWS